MIIIKTDKDLSVMRDLGKKTAGVLDALVAFTKAGHTTKDIEDKANALMESLGVKPAFLGCYGFPGSLCISVNEELIHGIPRATKVIADGDIVSIDMGLKSRGWFSDMATTFPVGNTDALKTDMLHVGREALARAIAAVRPGATIGDVSWAIQSYVEQKGYQVVKKFVGHGIGRKLHEEPEIPNFGAPGKGPKLRKGMTLAIEPMITASDDDVYIAKDDWTVIAKDGKPCVHFEHTVAVTDTGAEILTV